jgi:peptidoglycan/LPS O-acetylase OafA/YrhL
LSVASMVIYGTLVLTFLPHRFWANALRQLPFLLPAFACGVVAASWWVRVRANRYARHLVATGALGYVSLSYAFRGVSAESSPAIMLLITPFACMTVLGVAWGACGWLASFPLRFIGSISFSLYLWHLVFITLVPIPLIFSNSLGSCLAWVLAVSIAFSALNYQLIERPFLLLRPKRYQG